MPSEYSKVRCRQLYVCKTPWYQVGSHHNQGKTGLIQTDTFTPTGNLQFSIHLAYLCLGCRRKSENLKETHGEHANSKQALLHFHCLTTCFRFKFVVKTQNQTVKSNTGHDPQTQCICSFVIPDKPNAVKCSQVSELSTARCNTDISFLLIVVFHTPLGGSVNVKTNVTSVHMKTKNHHS